MSEFNGTLAPQAWMIAPETQNVMRALLDDGGDARFVGGCVRDALANRPVVDIDIATPSTPDEVIERLTRHALKYAPTGLKHGTVTAIANGKPFEVTTLRVDVKTFGRHAEVAFTDDWKEDAARRDFTINAMSATIDGRVFDPFGGISDLREGCVRFVGNPGARITEDYLRILRFFRFHAHFGRGAADERALAACHQHAEKITTLSAERLRHEMLRLLEADACADVWHLMRDAGVARRILSEARDETVLARLVLLEKRYHGAVFPLRRLAALTPSAENLRLSNREQDQLKIMAHVPPAPDAKAARALVYRHGNDLALSLVLLAAARDGGEPDAAVDAALSFHAHPFPLAGADVAALGITPSPRTGELLHSVESWWIENDFAPDRAACLEKLKTLAHA